MEFARRVSDDELVFAEDYLDTHESPYGFYCSYDGCGIELRLKSYNSQKNLRAPYFAPRYKDKSHTKECVVNSRKKIKTTNGIDNSAPISYKNVLIFEDDSGSRSVINNIAYSEDKKNAVGNGKLFHNRTAKHLASIVRWYLQNPTEGYRELKVPGCIYRDYQSVFQEIYVFSQEKYKNTHVFFGQLFLKNHCEKRENQIVFNLYQGKFYEPIKLIIDTKGWKDSSKKFVINLAKKAVEQTSEAFRKNIKGVYAYVFFLGYVDEVSRRVFHCNNHAAFFSMAIDNLDLPSNNYGIYIPPKIPIPKKPLDDNVRVFVERDSHRKTSVAEKLDNSDLFNSSRSISNESYQNTSSKVVYTKSQNVVDTNKSKLRSFKVIKKRKLTGIVKKIIKSLLRLFKTIKKRKLTRIVKDFLNVFF